MIELCGSSKVWWLLGKRRIYMSQLLHIIILACATYSKSRGFNKNMGMWDLYKILLIILYIIKVNWSQCFSNEFHPRCSNIVVMLESLAKSLKTNLTAFHWTISTEWTLFCVCGDQTLAAYSIIISWMYIFDSI